VHGAEVQLLCECVRADGLGGQNAYYWKRIMMGYGRDHPKLCVTPELVTLWGGCNLGGKRAQLECSHILCTREVEAQAGRGGGEFSGASSSGAVSTVPGAQCVPGARV